MSEERQTEKRIETWSYSETESDAEIGRLEAARAGWAYVTSRRLPLNPGAFIVEGVRPGPDDHDELRSERDEALEQVESLRQQHERTLTLVKNKSRVIDTLARERNAALGQVKSLESDFRMMLDAHARVSIARDKFAVQLAEARNVVPKLEAELAATRDDFDTIRDELARKDAEAAILRRRYHSMLTHVGSLQRQLATAQAISDQHRLAVVSRDATIMDLRRRLAPAQN